MWCAKCKNDLFDCTCPDLEERLHALRGPGSHVALPRCVKCGKELYICKCAKGELVKALIKEAKASQ